MRTVKRTYAENAYIVFNLRKRKFFRNQIMHGENGSLGFIEAVYQWK